MGLLRSTLLPMAEMAATCGEVPIAAAVVRDGHIIATAHNLVETHQDPTAHAELLVIRAAAARLGTPRLTDCDLYVTLEPCAMCAQAISMARIRRLVFGAYDPKGGAVEHGAKLFQQPTCHHAPEVIGGVMEAECGELLRRFFQPKR